MSEWYENKTIKELDGKRVRIQYNNGSAIEGKLYKDGNSAAISFGMFGTRSALYKHGGVFEKVSDCIESVTLLDDDNMTRIDDIDDVRSGDTFVGTDGKQFKVIDVDFNDTRFRLRVTFAGGEFWIKNDYFAYALRPKPQLPTEPGLYKDTANDTRLWIRDETESLPWTLAIKDSMAHGGIYSNEEVFASLHGATLYPVKIKRVES